MTTSINFADSDWPSGIILPNDFRAMLSRQQYQALQHDLSVESLTPVSLQIALEMALQHWQVPYWQGLTPKAQVVLQGLLLGEKPKQIAYRLPCCDRTIRHYLGQLRDHWQCHAFPAWMWQLSYLRLGLDLPLLANDKRD